MLPRPPMLDRRFRQVDVFTRLPYRGNPLAVVLDAAGLDTPAMQNFTDWTNLSEATFVLPPTRAEADYAVRIFCPGRELPFAGHPTLGTCHAWLEAGGIPKAAGIVQECGAGLVRIRRDSDRLAFAAPPLTRRGPLSGADLDRLTAGLGVDPVAIVQHAWCDNGPPWQAVLLPSAAAVLAVRPDASVLAGRFVGVVGPYRPGDHDCAFEVRAFFPGNHGIAEDPVTGSLNAALAQWLIGVGLAPSRYIASQGTALGRAGRVHVERDATGEVWIGGSTVTCVTGSVTL